MGTSLGLYIGYRPREAYCRQVALVHPLGNWALRCDIMTSGSNLGPLAHRKYPCIYSICGHRPHQYQICNTVYQWCFDHQQKIYRSLQQGYFDQLQRTIFGTLRAFCSQVVKGNFSVFQVLENHLYSKFSRNLIVII